MVFKSMTGFGRGLASCENVSWLVEVKSVNHRFLDQRISLPANLCGLEDKVKSRVADCLHRGRVEVSVSQQSGGKGALKLAVDLDLAAQYRCCLEQVQKELSLAGDISLADIMAVRDIIYTVSEDVDIDKEWATISSALAAALLECDTMRMAEGERLRAELSTRLDNFALLVATIEKKSPDILRLRQDELAERIGRLLAGVDIDPLRLAQEAAIMADKVDITEEIVRLKSHVEQFRRFFSCVEPVGRRLDFLLQEFLREVNTLASKISNSELAHVCVEMKNEVEKLREQVQNIE